MIKRFHKYFFLLLFGMLTLLPWEAFSQGNNFQIANRLMQQQQYEDALPILERLYEQNPEANIFFERYVECLTNLRKFDQAIEVAVERLNRGTPSISTRIRIGEIYHMKGDSTQAFELWEEVINSDNATLQTYYQVGNTLTNRREYQKAAELYQEARTRFDDDSLFTNEVANARLQNGDFAGAMQEYVKLVIGNPNQINFVQQRLLRMRDNELYKVAALEVEDSLLELELSNPSYSSLNQLLTWLLIETGEYQRAFVAARRFESRTDVLNYSLYAMGGQLLSNNQFELAADAYRYYVDNARGSVRIQSKEQEAVVYQRWAGFLDDYNLEDVERREELFQKAYTLNENLLNEFSSYNHRARVLVRQAEMALDVFFDREKAVRWIEELENEVHGNQDRLANLNYLKGRLHLFDRSFVEARQTLTRANRDAEDSNLAEKARYFLSLSDFFAGDFEFARIQLRSLERRNVSYYANDALKLRMWIQDGLRADTTGEALQNFADVLQTLHKGNVEVAIRSLRPILESPHHPLKDDALVEIAANINIRQVPYIYVLISDFNSHTNTSPLKERLLWEQAKLAGIIVEAGGPEQINANYAQLVGELIDDPDLKQQFNWPVSAADLENLYESLILEFPQGFYAPYAREQLQSLTELSS